MKKRNIIKSLFLVLSLSFGSCSTDKVTTENSEITITEFKVTNQCPKSIVCFDFGQYVIFQTNKQPDLTNTKVWYAKKDNNYQFYVAPIAAKIGNNLWEVYIPIDENFLNQLPTGAIGGSIDLSSVYGGYEIKFNGKTYRETTFGKGFN